jgi:hypothetical protein
MRPRTAARRKWCGPFAASCLVACGSPSGTPDLGSTGSPQVSSTIDHEVTETKSVRVPAGTFDTIEITWSSDQTSGKIWNHADVGQVASDIAELQSTQAGRR